MKRNLFVLPDGTRIYSGVNENPAIKSVKYTRDVNSSTDLDYAAACAAAVDVELIDTVGSFSMLASTELIYKTVDADGAETQVGCFLMEAPTKSSQNVYKFTAYDRMILLDKDISEWLAGLTEWPYTMRSLLVQACQKCGVALADNIELVNGEYPVQKFVRQITGRQIVQWVAGANAAFATMTPEGLLTFTEYTDGGQLDLSRRSMTVTDYCTAPIQRVVVKQDEEDVGVAWPENSEGETYTVMGNPLLSTFSSDDLLPYVENLAGRIIGLTYTPLTADVWDEAHLLSPGKFYTVNRGGREYTTAVFSLTRRGDITTIKSTGNSSRNSASAVNEQDKLEILQGRVARLKVGLEEVSSELSLQQITLESVSRETSQIAQTVDGISTKVESVETTVDGVSTSLTQVQQKTDGLEVTVGRVESSLDDKADRATVEEITEHFLFQEDGLTIFNSATGMGINVSEQQVAFTGGKDPTTVITPNQMETTKLVVGERLDLGEFSYLPRSNGNLSFRYIGG